MGRYLMIIDLPLFAGIYTNADLEDIDPKYCRELINFEPKDSRLVKAEGVGS